MSIVSRGDGRRRLRVSRRRRRRHADSRLHHARQETSRATSRSNRPRRSSRIFNGYYTIKYPFGKLDMVAIPDFAAERDGEHGGNLLPRTRAARRQRDRVGRHAQGHRRHDRARDGPPVVRRSRHDAVVGRSLAERRLRDLDGNASAGRVEAGVEHRGGRSARHPGGARTSIRCGRRARFTPPVQTPAEIESLFDAISYQKGAAVLRMIEHYVGAGAVPRRHQRLSRDARLRQRDVRGFLDDDRRHLGQAGRSDPPDVHQSAGRAARRGVAPHMHGGRSDARDVHARNASCSQQTRSAHDDRLAGAGVPQDRDAADASACVVLRTGSGHAGRRARLRSWIFANAGAQGYYRTEYAPEMLRSLAPHLADALTAPERLIAHRRRVGARAGEPAQRRGLPDAGRRLRPRVVQRRAERSHRAARIHS